MTKSGGGNNRQIDDVKTIDENLSSRAGLAFFPPYLNEIGMLDRLEETFGNIRKINKGISVREAFKQLICFFVDGTDFHLTRFDELAEDRGYRKTIQTESDQIASSHQMKRFLRSFSFVRNFHFRYVFGDLFLWRIKHTQPDVITLDIDTMVMNNNDAYQREGVDPTYKDVRGFQPVFLKYNGTIVDAVLRRGSKHSNNGQTAIKMIKRVVKKIRTEYRKEVPIIITADSGFYDGKLFKELEELGVGYLIGGRLEEQIEEFTETFSDQQWIRYEKENQSVYELLEFMYGCKQWDRSRRMIMSRRVYDGDQKQLSFARKRNVYVTNLGIDQPITEALRKIKESKESVRDLLDLAHSRGGQERLHRSLKEFGTEKLPMIRFVPNNAYFNIMVLSYNLWKAFKDDALCEEVLSSNCMPNTFRRKFLDVAGKIAETERYIYLKVTEAVKSRLNLKEIWKRVNSPPVPALC